MESTIATRLRQLRAERNFSQARLAKELGITQQAVSKWESGGSFPDPTQLVNVANLLGVSADYLYGLSDLPSHDMLPPGGGQYVPVIGSVRAGYNALAFQEQMGQELADVADPSQYCYLRVKGDSMEPYIHQGDLALVRHQSTLENGQIGVFIYNDEESTMKRFIRRKDEVILEPFNENYEPVVLSGEALGRLFIFGRVVETKTRW